MRWHVKHPCGCSDISISIMPRRSSLTDSFFVSTVMSGIGVAVQDATVIFLPFASVSTTHVLHAP